MTNNLLLRNAIDKQWLFLCHPVKIFEVWDLNDVAPVLTEIDTLTSSFGYYAAGFISYEAATAFDCALSTHSSTSFPLMWFGIFNDARQLPVLPFAQLQFPEIWQSNITSNQYSKVLSRIKYHIARGNTYQVNYTFRNTAPFIENPKTAFLSLTASQPTDFAAYVDTERFAICSASPELFFILNGQNIITRPMKGTAARGLTYEDDVGNMAWLYNSKKNRAENLMIVDMVRNDLGRIAIPGTVQVPILFEIEKYPTLLQMTSTVTAKTNATVSDIIASLFPCASITGAPKARTMQIIKELETTPRKIYTGSIGFIGPNRTAQFNVAIRTVLIDKEKNQAEYGVGGGILWDSTTEDEFDECRLKTQVLTKKQPEFSILETLLWTPDSDFFLLDYHLSRLFKTASYFEFPVDIQKAKQVLAQNAPKKSSKFKKIRFLLKKDGSYCLESETLDTNHHEQPLKIRLASDPIDTSNPFLYHKTTHRDVYDKAFENVSNCDDVILYNQQDQVTESTISNIVINWQNQLITPPVCSGLLPGTFREWLLLNKKIEEQIITIDMLKKCKIIFLVNSVRKWRRATLLV